MKKYDKLIEQAKKAFADNDLVLAAQYYEEAFTININVADYLMLGYIYIDIDKLQLAENIFKQVNSVMENDESNFALGNICERTSRNSDAINYYEKIQDKSLFPQCYFSLGYLYDDLATENKESWESENIKKSIHNYQMYLQFYEDDFWCFENLGSIYERYNKNDIALEYFTKGYQIGKDNDNACYNLGVVYSKLGNGEQALYYYEEELKKENPYQETYYNLGILYKDYFKDFVNAKICYLKGLKLYPDNYNLWYNLACVYALLKDYDNAYDCFKYLYYKNKNYFDYIVKDEELNEFRDSDCYKQLQKLAI